MSDNFFSKVCSLVVHQDLGWIIDGVILYYSFIEYRFVSTFLLSIIYLPLLFHD